MILSIIGLVLIGVGIFGFFRRRTLKNHLLSLKLTASSTIAELQQMQQSITQELGQPGAFCELVKLRGKLHCKNPLTAELSQRSCVYYKSSITEKYETVEWENDSEGKRRKVRRTKTRKVNHNESQISFLLEDETGKIKINPNEAKIDAIQVVNRFEPANSQGLSISWGGVSLNLPTRFDSDYRTLGYQYEEEILPIDIEISVFGELRDQDNELVVKRPADKKQPFLISHKSQDEVVQDQEKELSNTIIWSTVCPILGVILLGIGLITGV
ncbi:E3 ubiquitin ligase family protein [Spirulina subsalsa FACHB-351]|uniref:RING-type E3 ubiquitin transferase n=1 Tax=Spirulina subsalsa FACHB-351 TaxID=234711 RepID=A0ABT3L7T9_9CYAN|nr:E3 ubiquitin ligase family protein [Spirulina subsalsa]MCW6037563.1 E3 ubiquitin ligase family protein [Spirulina subsalsa FACHB-351]